MALTQPELERVVAEAQSRFPRSQPPTVPAELTTWSGGLLAAFTPDAARPTTLPPPCFEDLLVTAAFVAYGPAGTAAPTAVDLDPLYASLASPRGPDAGRAAERVLVDGALRGWIRARETLLELICRVVRPALRWLYHKNIDDRRGLRQEEWVEQEASDAGAAILEALLERCCCHLSARELTLQDEPAQRRCRTQHCLTAWDRKEFLAKFLCRATVYLRGPKGCRPYYHTRLNDFPKTRHHPTVLAVNEFRKGMLAKFVFQGRLRAGNVLRCTMTPGCSGQIDPAKDRCDTCKEQSEAGKPQDYWLWVDERYRPRQCLKCRTCGYYYFQYHRACPRQSANGPAHRWSGNGPRRVWVRERHGGGDVLEYQPAPEAPPLRWGLTPAGRERFRQAVAAIPPGPVHDLAAELLCEEPDLRKVARRRAPDVLAGAFLQQFREALCALPDLLPADPEVLFREEETDAAAVDQNPGPSREAQMADLARLLLVKRRSLRNIARDRGEQVNHLPFRNAMLEVLTRVLGAILQDASVPLPEDEFDPAVGGPDAGLMAFLATLPADDQRDLAVRLFGAPEPVAVPAGPEALVFVGRMLRIVRAVRPGLPFDLVERFAGGELEAAARLLFDDQPLTLGEVEDRLRRDHGDTRPGDTVLGLLLNVIYAVNGLATQTTCDEEDEG